MSIVLPAPYRDRQILSLIAGLLTATGEFDEVRTSGLPEVQGGAAVEARLACLELQAWEEFDQSDDYQTITQDRTMRFSLHIIVRNQDPDTRDDEVDRLLNLSMDVINGQSIGGVSIPSYTRLRRGTWIPAAGPERRMVVQGELRYQIPNFDAHALQP